MLNDYGDLLTDDIRRLWPMAALVADRLDGRLVGGTALALHLRHRRSEDLDIHTLTRFSGTELAKHMRSYLESACGPDNRVRIMLQWAEDGGYSARLDRTKLDVFRTLSTSNERTNRVRWLESRPAVVEGMPVAGIPDILAMKLEAVSQRRQLRDYIDLAAIDRMTACSLESGIDCYRRKYLYDEYPSPAAMRRVAAALSDHSCLPPDPLCEHARSDALGYLTTRARDVHRHISSLTDTL